jgi:hypothetical protein
MSEKLYIRVKKDGFIYEHSERLAVHPECEVVSEMEAYPERFITPEVAEKIEAVTKAKAKVGRGRKGAEAVQVLDLFTDIPEEPVYTDPELASEAAEGWPE